jgi:hypothetical protein
MYKNIIYIVYKRKAVNNKVFSMQSDEALFLISSGRR